MEEQLNELVTRLDALRREREEIEERLDRLNAVVEPDAGSLEVASETLEQPSDEIAGDSGTQGPIEYPKGLERLV